ncbi:MAG: ATP-binding protein [Chloroflexota bacterium]
MKTVAVMLDARKLLKTAFADMPDEDIHSLERVAKPCTFPKGVDICKEGEEGDRLYIIGEGWTDIIVHAENGQEIVVDKIGPGAYFGEMSLLGQTTRSATIRTKSECFMLEISHEDFEKAIITNPSLLRRMMHRIIGHLRRNDRAVIQELNRANGELVEAYDELAEQEALRSKFVMTLTHEIRTPLTKIRGYLDLINKGAMNEQTLPVAMGSITRNVEHMVGLTNDMFLLYEMNPAQPQYTSVNLPDLLVEALQVTRENLGDSETAVQFKLAPNLPPIIADRKTLLLALRAIIGNAFKYDPNNQPVTIDAFCHEGEIAIAIQDQGIGIPSDEQERIFDPFYRLEEEGSTHLFPGIGVGLTIAKFIVSRHNGRIDVSSRPKSGSTFTIYLPLK